MSIESDRKDDSDISWRVVAYACAGVLWAISFAMLIWLCNGVSTLKQDMAVVKNVLHIDRSQARSETVGNAGQYNEKYNE
jgi:hypothetical protein